MKMKASEAIVKMMEMEGITDAFGIPGAGINGLYKYMAQANIRHYCHRHEEACVHAAGAYFRASGRMAAALCTSGPGATNFVTGIYTCNIDSIPVLAITGQAVRAQLGKDAFQCVDIAKICEPVAKKTYCIVDPEEVPVVFSEAIRIAKEGKPGPVLIDLPLDVQNAEIDFEPSAYQPQSFQIPSPKPEEIATVLDMIQAAKSPVMIMGGGVILAEAAEECVRLAEQLNIPVITTYMAKGGIPAGHPLNAGHCGIQVGQPIGNKVFLQSDLVLGIGCRFSDRHTGNLDTYVKGRKFIHINIAEQEIGKILTPELGIVADAKLTIEAMLNEAKTRNISISPQIVPQLPALRKELARKVDYDCKPINPHRVFGELNQFFGDETIFTTGCGITQIWSGQLQDINLPRRYLPSGGSGTLGYDIPAAFGASIATGKRAVAVMGDFGFTFHVQELAVCAKNHIPVIVVIVNNAYLGLIRQNQKGAYGYEYAVEMSENQGMVDYVKVAEGFACYGERVFDPADIPAALQRAVDSGKPAVIDIICDPQVDCSMGTSLDNVKEFVY
ncbi:thiamine pyrophosphate-dependent enzyme [Massiliimalia timonensis]|uniref:thiamine pyrophosphate-dependent enzyme n=1 Tax=Massiliimalia timonensis TaxID=1987501 RepID=UPI001E5C157E|nr:thiamine pyrophosphate-dependent enzyme [Massiliimalia timonensis]